MCEGTIASASSAAGSRKASGSVSVHCSSEVLMSVKRKQSPRNSLELRNHVSDVVGTCVKAGRVNGAEHSLRNDAKLAHPDPCCAPPALDRLPRKSRHVCHKILRDRVERVCDLRFHDRMPQHLVFLGVRSRYRNVVVAQHDARASADVRAPASYESEHSRIERTHLSRIYAE